MCVGGGGGGWEGGHNVCFGKVVVGGGEREKERERF